MLASDMISTIKKVERECHGITQMYATRISLFQSENLPMTQGVEYDSAFDDFVKELENVMGTVYIPTAKKILNNWYLWAKGNLEALSKIEPFVEADNSFDWLIKNNFRVDHKAFAKDVSEEAIKKVEKQMPKNSELYLKLKAVADKKFSEDLRERGFSYPYLVKVVAGFSEAWS